MPRMKGLAVDGSGAVWMTDAILDRVAVYDDAGRFLLDVGRPGRREGEFSFPAGIAIGADGRVAVVDSFNARVQLFRFKSAGGAK
jgi:DNA-binding beta-propeller fold protein YncE